MLTKQHTLKREISVSGTGLHTGKNVNITFKPAHENHGIKFKRIDIENKPVIDADVDNVVDTSRGTTLEQNGASVYTTEHVLAAIIGSGIDNILIELDQLEIPIMDGSSKYFVEAFEKVGVVEQNADREYIEITSNIEYINPGNKVKITASPSDDYKINVDIDFETKVLNTQSAKLNNINNFNEEISKCRTFVFLHELEFLLKNDLIKGGDLSNAIVFVNKKVSQKELDHLAALFNKPKIKVLKEGILNNLELQYPNEPARHKLLDVVGDLALLGKPIKGTITAKRPGHMSNVQFAKLIKQQYLKNKSKMNEVPNFDLNKKPVYNINQIKKILPHRPPFLFVDKILELSDTHVVGLKNVTMNESFFIGHFPDEPIFPGVIQIEAMAQTGGILVLNSVPDPENYLTYFMKIDNVKFRKPVIPGDTIVFVLELISPMRRGLANMKGKAYVGGKVVMEAVMLAQITKVK